MKNKKAFTLVELLAVIAILAIILLIAIPLILGIIEDAKQESFRNSIRGVFDAIAIYHTRTSISHGNIQDLSMSGEPLTGTWEIVDGKITIQNATNGTYTVLELTMDNRGQKFPIVKDGQPVLPPVVENPKPVKNCSFSGELIQGAEYTDELYVYRYKQSASSSGWINMNNDGWGVELKNPEATEAITIAPCTYIDEKPIVSMAFMFYNSKATAIDLKDFHTTNVVDMGRMFYGMSNITKLDVRDLDTSNVLDMASMFTNMSQLKELQINGIDTSKVQSMASMFSWTSLTSLDISELDTSSVTNMMHMFSNMRKLQTLNLGDKFNTSNVTDMSHMFVYDLVLKSLDLHTFNTSKTTNMGSMFQYMNALEELNLQNFDTSNVSNFSSMFSSMPQLKSLDIRNAVFSKAESYGYIFTSSSNLSTIYAKDEEAKSFLQARATDSNITPNILIP